MKKIFNYGWLSAKRLRRYKKMSSTRKMVFDSGRKAAYYKNQLR